MNVCCLPGQTANIAAAQFAPIDERAVIASPVLCVRLSRMLGEVLRAAKRAN